MKPATCLLLISLLIFIPGCGPEQDDDDSSDSSDTSTACVEFDSSDDLNEALTLDESCYQLSGTLTVDAGELTIGPETAVHFQPDTVLIVETSMTIGAGATLIFGEDAALNIDGGSLTADASGEDVESIRFIGAREVAGHWQGIRLANSSQTNQLANVEVRHGGSALWDQSWSVTRANILVDEGATLQLNDVDIADSGHHGISVTGGQLQGCDDLRFTNIERHHIFAAEPEQGC